MENEVEYLECVPILNFENIANQFVRIDSHVAFYEKESQFEDSKQLDVRRVLSAITIWLERLKDDKNEDGTSRIQDVMNLFQGKEERRQYGAKWMVTDYWQGKNYHLDQCWDWFTRYMAERPTIGEKIPDEIMDDIKGKTCVHRMLPDAVKKEVKNQFQQVETHLGRYFDIKKLQPLTAAFAYKIIEAMHLTKKEWMKIGLDFLCNLAGDLLLEKFWKQTIVLPCSFSILEGFDNHDIYDTGCDLNFQTELTAYLTRLRNEDEGIEKVHDSMKTKTPPTEVESDCKIVTSDDIEKELKRVEQRYATTCKQYVALSKQMLEERLLKAKLQADLKAAQKDEQNENILKETLGVEKAKVLLADVKAQAVEDHKGVPNAFETMFLQLCQSLNQDPLQAIMQSGVVTYLPFKVPQEIIDANMLQNLVEESDARQRLERNQLGVASDPQGGVGGLAEGSNSQELVSPNVTTSFSLVNGGQVRVLDPNQPESSFIESGRVIDSEALLSKTGKRKKRQLSTGDQDAVADGTKKDKKKKKVGKKERRSAEKKSKKNVQKGASTSREFVELSDSD